MTFCAFLGSYEEPPGGGLCATKRRNLHNPDSGFSYERPGGDEHLPGDANQFWFNFLCFGTLSGF